MLFLGRAPARMLRSASGYPLQAPAFAPPVAELMRGAFRFYPSRAYVLI